MVGFDTFPAAIVKEYCQPFVLERFDHASIITRKTSLLFQAVFLLLLRLPGNQVYTGGEGWILWSGIRFLPATHGNDRMVLTMIY
jgi:hypothetical protein